MKASFVDLRSKSGEVVRALDRKEAVTVLYRGRPKAIMQPIASSGAGKRTRTKNHPAFGLWADRQDLKDVAAHVRRLRKGRFHAV